ncbi:MAG TPA: hypothetical protein EYG73_04515 [Arcobacter sp.]|nr:hypothetical protein [Arcobacter sp.]
MLAVLSITTFAFNMDDCSEGRTVYIDELIDLEAVIIKCDYSDDTIKVRLDKDDKTKWVKPSELMGSVGKEVEDYFEEKAIDFVLGCLFGDTCKDKNN